MSQYCSGMRLRGEDHTRLRAALISGLALLSAWLILGALAAEKGGASPGRSAAEAFDTLGASVPAFGGITYDDIGARGAVVNESVSLSGD